LLSRVTWPIFSTQNVIRLLEKSVQSGKVKRVCIQALNYPRVLDEVCAFVKALKQQVSVPISVSCQPLNSQNIWNLAEAGADRIGIALDSATEALFDRVKGAAAGGPYRWQTEFLLLRTAVGVFGEGNVSTHLIVGLGETEKDAASLVQECMNLGVLPGLFAFTPISGTALADRAQPDIASYRRVQLARHLIVNGFARVEDMRFNRQGSIVDFGVSKPQLLAMVAEGQPFLTSGCPDCNRPFYNEKPSGPIYNYPRALTPPEITEVKKQLAL
jgi:biotin synthase